MEGIDSQTYQGTRFSVSSRSEPAVSGDEDSTRRTGNVWSASAIMISVVIGSGILPLAWALAQLGWIIGPLVILFFFFSATVSTSVLLSACYQTVDQQIRPNTYQDAVRTFLGEMDVVMYGTVNGLSLFGMAIGDIIASSLSVMALWKFHCFHVDHGKDGCHMNINTFMLATGIFQFRGSLTGISIGRVTLCEKISRILLAVGDIAFAFCAYSNTIFEVQDRVESPVPLGLKKLKKAIMISSAFMTFLYLLCSCLSYAAFGDHSIPRNLLSDIGFGFNKPYNWLLVMENVALVIQYVGAYQVHSRALSDVIEAAITRRFPTLITGEIIIPCFRPCELKYLFRLVWITIFHVTTTLISMGLPFFNDVVGLIGALGFWPLTVYFPVQMYIVQKGITKWSTKWFLLQILSVLCFIITIAGAAGSIAGFVLDLETLITIGQGK